MGMISTLTFSSAHGLTRIPFIHPNPNLWHRTASRFANFFPVFVFLRKIYFLIEPSPTRFNFRYHSRSTFLAERGWKSFSFSNANACSHLTLLTHLSRFEGNIMMLSVRGRERAHFPRKFCPIREPIS